MSVTDVHKDYEKLTLTLTAEFDAPVERVWQLWADPRQLERWWGPPTWPATVETHDLTPGGEVTYFMTGPEGEKSRGWWQVISVQPPTVLEFKDGFADEDGKPVPDSPTTTTRVELTPRDGGGTRALIRTVFSSKEQMEETERMGAFKVFVQCLEQAEALLAA